ncbi:hypothetical protein CSUI_005762 [Cystoisospora suis]|uniref:Uncharacterized protein n=1 Tax=Cystoisospora suis TaxID=483139 RepID=A0A2C6K461_9APIC|nr:hypothetical protein CSUI_005762 [Cystoisospora suis]
MTWSVHGSHSYLATPSTERRKEFSAIRACIKGEESARTRPKVTPFPRTSSRVLGKLSQLVWLRLSGEGDAQGFLQAENETHLLKENSLGSVCVLSPKQIERASEEKRLTPCVQAVEARKTKKSLICLYCQSGLLWGKSTSSTRSYAMSTLHPRLHSLLLSLSVFVVVAPIYSTV